jgi:hypothetical protein
MNERGERASEGTDRPRRAADRGTFEAGFPGRANWAGSQPGGNSRRVVTAQAQRPCRPMGRSALARPAAPGPRQVQGAETGRGAGRKETRPPRQAAAGRRAGGIIGRRGSKGAKGSGPLGRARPLSGALRGAAPLKGVAKA